MTHGVIKGNATGSTQIRNIQQKIIMITVGGKKRNYCGELFNKMNILPLTSNYLLPLPSFILDNTEKFQRNSDIKNTNIKHKYDFHMLNANLCSYQKEMYCTGIKLFINLPSIITRVNMT
jgi:hypothetical protein